MNLHVKLFLPTLIFLVIIAIIIHFYWLPSYLKSDYAEQLKSEHVFIELLGASLTTDLLNNDLAKIYASLDNVLESREHWHAIELYDQDSNRVYPLSISELTDSSYLDLISNDIIFNNHEIANIKIWSDVKASSADRIEYIYHLEKILLLVLVMATVIATFLQDRWIRLPLGQLSRFASDIASGKYDSHMEYSSRDEVGKLVEAFNSMRQQIGKREADLLESEKWNKAVIENAVDGIISIDAHGTVMSVNPATEKIFGYESNEIIGENVKMLMPEPYHKEHDGYLYNYLSTGKKKIIGIGREVVGLRKDGSTFPLDLAVSEVKIDDRLLFIGIIRDITERKRIEQMKTEFVSTVSHELRTPLTSIRGALSLVLGKSADSLPPKVLRMLETANRNSERLTFLINDILDLEKIDSGNIEFYLEIVDLASLAKRAIDENEGYAQSHNVSLKLSVEESAVTIVKVDQQRLLQVFANLISNAIKYSPEKGVVNVVVKQIEDRVRVSVVDKGLGIPTEFQDRIFERFSQADSSDTREKGGTGLGLTITKAIVEQLGGRIGFSSTPGEGCEFFFDLTIIEQYVENNEADETLPKVLVCEDDADVAFVLVSLLEQEGLAGDIASTVSAASQLVKKNDYRLLLLDLNLPDGSGLELVRDLRANEDTRGLPIIVVSGKANEGREDFNGDAITVADWLQKPIDRERLSQAVDSALLGNSRPHILHVEDSLDVIQVSQALFEEDNDFEYATSLREAREKLSASTFDLVIVDISLPDGSGFELFDEIGRDIPIVLFSGQEVTDVNKKVSAILTKSRTSNEDLINTVRKLLKRNG